MSNVIENKELELKQKQTLEQGGSEPTRSGVWFVPTVDIVETASEIIVQADLPGVTQEGLDVDLKDDVLTLTGAVGKVPESRKLVYREYDVGGFTRQFRLGQVVDQTKITAKLNHGILTVVLPKVEKAKPRKISITG
jgi:HSP20 family protein